VKKYCLVAPASMQGAAHTLQAGKEQVAQATPAVDRQVLPQAEEGPDNTLAGQRGGAPQFVGGVRERTLYVAYHLEYTPVAVFRLGNICGGGHGDDDDGGVAAHAPEPPRWAMQSSLLAALVAVAVPPQGASSLRYARSVQPRGRRSEYARLVPYFWTSG